LAYSDGEALILTQIQATDDFNSSNSIRNNWNLLNNGKSAHYCIVRRGPFTRQQRGMGGSYLNRWITVAELWVKLIDYDQALLSIEQKEATISARFDAFRKAGDNAFGNIQDVFVRGGEEIVEMIPTAGRSPTWVKQNLIIEWQEEANVTLQE